MTAWCVAWQPVEGLQISRMPMIHTRFRFRFVALTTRTLISLLFRGNPPFSTSMQRLCGFFDFCGGITQSNLTTASSEDRIIIPFDYALSSSTTSKPIVKENWLVESSDDMLWSFFFATCENEGRENVCDAIKAFIIKQKPIKVCESSPAGTQAQVTKLFPMIRAVTRFR